MLGVYSSRAPTSADKRRRLADLIRWCQLNRGDWGSNEELDLTLIILFDEMTFKVYRVDDGKNGFCDSVGIPGLQLRGARGMTRALEARSKAPPPPPPPP